MKNRKTKNEFKRSMLECLIEIKTQLDLDPRVKTSPIIKMFDVYKSTFNHLKSIGVVSQTNDGHFWIGIDPDWNMVSLIQKRESEYQMEYRKRKNSGMFQPMNRPSHKKGKRNPKPIQRNLFDQIQMDQTRIQMDPQTEKRWKQQIERSKQNAVKTNIPIRNNEMNDPETEKRLNELIDLQNQNQKLLDSAKKTLDEIKSTEQHVDRKTRIFEFRLFGFTFFTFKY
jgi:hypothetical protein